MDYPSKTTITQSACMLKQQYFYNSIAQGQEVHNTLNPITAHCYKTVMLLLSMISIHTSEHIGKTSKLWKKRISSAYIQFS